MSNFFIQKNVHAICSKCKNIIFYYLDSPDNLTFSCSCQKKSISLHHFVLFYQPTDNSKVTLNTKCETHNKQFSDYCIDCSLHLCEECLPLHTKHRNINFQKLKSEYIDKIQDNLERANSVQQVIDKKVKEIIHDYQRKINSLQLSYENYQTRSSSQLKYIQFIYDTFTSLPSINNYDVIKNLIVNTTFNRTYFYHFSYIKDYNSMDIALHYCNPLVSSEKFANIVSEKVNEISMVKPFHNKQGIVFIFKNSNSLGIFSRTMTSLRDGHIYPINSFCILDNDTIVSCCKKKICVWKHEKINKAIVIKNTQFNIDPAHLCSIKENKFLTYHYDNVTLYNGITPYDTIATIKLEKPIRYIMQLSDLTIAAFLDWGIIKTFDDKLIETSSTKLPSYLEKNVLFGNAVEINDSRVFCYYEKKIVIFNMKSKQIEMIQLLDSSLCSHIYYSKKKNCVLIGDYSKIVMFDVKKLRFIQNLKFSCYDYITFIFEYSELITFKFNEKILANYIRKGDCGTFIYLLYALGICNQYRVKGENKIDVLVACTSDNRMLYLSDD